MYQSNLLYVAKGISLASKTLIIYRMVVWSNLIFVIYSFKKKKYLNKIFIYIYLYLYVKSKSLNIYM